MQFQNHWNETHKRLFTGKAVYDNWLDDYKQVLDKTKTCVLDLGCGNGNDTLYLTEKGFKVIACDFSLVALENVKLSVPNVETKQLDISQTLPFENESFDLIIADLSLHYFDSKTTVSVMNEIKRILKSGGSLIARVNSTEDTNYGAGQGEVLEENFYFVDGYNKRFFTISDAEKFFSIIGPLNVKCTDMLRYAKPKTVIEINAQNK